MNMPGRGTPKITLRIPEEMWRRFGIEAQKVGLDRAALLRAFVAWFIHDGKLPPRP